VCFGRPSTPEVVRTDPVAEQRKAEELAKKKGFETTMARQQRRQRTALLTEGGAQTALQTYGQQTLGNAL
jgi:hypothetical protein